MSLLQNLERLLEHLIEEGSSELTSVREPWSDEKWAGFQEGLSVAILALQSILSETRAETGWHPTKTAPRDGRAILAKVKRSWNEKSYYALVAWWPQFHVDAPWLDCSDSQNGFVEEDILAWAPLPDISAEPVA